MLWAGLLFALTLTDALKVVVEKGTLSAKSKVDSCKPCCWTDYCCWVDVYGGAMNPLFKDYFPQFQYCKAMKKHMKKKKWKKPKVTGASGTIVYDSPAVPIAPALDYQDPAATEGKQVEVMDNTPFEKKMAGGNQSICFLNYLFADSTLEKDVIEQFESLLENPAFMTNRRMAFAALLDKHGDECNEDTEVYNEADGKKQCRKIDNVYHAKKPGQLADAYNGPQYLYKGVVEKKMYTMREGSTGRNGVSLAVSKQTSAIPQKYRDFIQWGLQKCRAELEYSSFKHDWNFNLEDMKIFFLGHTHGEGFEGFGYDWTKSEAQKEGSGMSNKQLADAMAGGLKAVNSKWMAAEKIQTEKKIDLLCFDTSLMMGPLSMLEYSKVAKKFCGSGGEAMKWEGDFKDVDASGTDPERFMRSFIKSYISSEDYCKWRAPVKCQNPETLYRSPQECKPSCELIKKPSTSAVDAKSGHSYPYLVSPLVKGYFKAEGTDYIIPWQVWDPMVYRDEKQWNFQRLQVGGLVSWSIEDLDEYRSTVEPKLLELSDKILEIFSPEKHGEPIYKEAALKVITARYLSVSYGEHEKDVGYTDLGIFLHNLEKYTEGATENVALAELYQAAKLARDSLAKATSYHSRAAEHLCLPISGQSIIFPNLASKKGGGVNEEECPMYDEFLQHEFDSEFGKKWKQVIQTVCQFPKDDVHFDFIAKHGKLSDPTKGLQPADWLRVEDCLPEPQVNQVKELYKQLPEECGFMTSGESNSNCYLPVE